MGCVQSNEPLPNVTTKHGYCSQYYEADAKPAAPIEGAFKAVGIGINYYDTKHELSSPNIDVHNMMRFLRRRGFTPQQGFRVLTDDHKGDMMPTRQNILVAIQWLVQGLAPGQSAFLHFSGHATRAGGSYHCLMPCDYLTDGLVRNSDLLRILSKSPVGSRVVMLFDTAYGCAVTDLPWKVSLGAKSYRWQQGRNARDMLCGHLMLICTEGTNETSSDVASAGALCHSLMENIDALPFQNYGDLLRRLREGLRKRLGKRAVHPVLSVSHKFDLYENFSIGCTDKDIALQKAYRGAQRGGTLVTNSKFFIGAMVEAWFHDMWYPAKVRQVCPDGTFHVDWEDGTTSLNLDVSALRELGSVGNDPPRPTATKASVTSEKKPRSVDESKVGGSSRSDPVSHPSDPVSPADPSPTEPAEASDGQVGSPRTPVGSPGP